MGVGAFSGVYIGLVIFLAIMAILWFLLPFAVFGTKDKLNQLIAEARNTNQAVQELTKEVIALRTAMAASRLPPPTPPSVRTQR
jgi:type II secretory pathway component PulM